MCRLFSERREYVRRGVLCVDANLASGAFATPGKSLRLVRWGIMDRSPWESHWVESYDNWNEEPSVVTTLDAKARLARMMELVKYEDLLEVFAWAIERSAFLRSTPISS